MSAVRWSIMRLVLTGILISFIGTVSAHAEDSTTTLTVDSDTGTMLPNSATAPEFDLNFMLNDVERLSAVPVGTTQNLEISLTSPNNPVFRFLFSPRPQFGLGYDAISGTNRAYAGLTWNLFTSDSIFSHFGLASSFDPAIGGGDPFHRIPFAPLMLHGAVELGYRFSDRNSLSLAIDQGVIPISHGSGPDAVENFLLRYGMKF